MWEFVGKVGKRKMIQLISTNENILKSEEAFRLERQFSQSVNYPRKAGLNLSPKAHTGSRAYWFVLLIPTMRREGFLRILSFLPLLNLGIPDPCKRLSLRTQGRQLL